MPQVTEQARLALEPDAAWTEIGGFGAVGDWHPMLERVESAGDTPGSRRVAHTADGGTQVERLDAYDAGRHAYRYVIEETAMPVRDYAAEFRVDPGDGGGSVLTWSASFDVTDGDDGQTVETIRAFLKAGTDAVEQRFG